MKVMIEVIVFVFCFDLTDLKDDIFWYVIGVINFIVHSEFKNK